MNKTCFTCKEEKDISLFGKRVWSSDGLDTYCKDCKKAYKKRQYYLNHERELEQKRRDYLKHKDKRDTKNKEYALKNKEQLQEYRKNRYIENKEEILQKQKIYRESNQESIKAKKSEYYSRPQVKQQRRIKYKKNVEKMRDSNYRRYHSEKGRKYREAKKVKTNTNKLKNFTEGLAKFPLILKILIDNYTNQKLINRLKIRVRSRTIAAIKSQRTFKHGSTGKLLGCTVPELVRFLENQFQSGMTWENLGYGPGKWNIDHKLALCLFNLGNKEEQNKAFHYTNLQPLWHAQHQEKSKNDAKLLAEKRNKMNAFVVL